MRVALLLRGVVQHLPDSVRLAPEPQAILNRLIRECEELQHIQEAAPAVVVLFSERALFLHGGLKAAIIVEPRWQGSLGQVAEFLVAQLIAPVLGGEDPDFLVIVDAAIWRGLDAERRERLMFHEALHLAVKEDEFGVARRDTRGRPLLRLVPHDVEVFISEVERYGIETVGIEAIAPAIVEGEARKRRRNLRIA